MDFVEGGVLTFGETMLRLSPPRNLRIDQAAAVDVWVAGCESNVAAGLCGLGIAATWVGRLPDNALGRKIESTLRGFGVDVSHIVWSGQDSRAGLLFAEMGSGPRPASVIYDRRNSAAASLAPHDLPDALFETHAHLHASGITPALSSCCRESVDDALSRAQGHGLTISFDVNYRSKLWTAQDAASTLEPMIQRADLLFCSRADADLLFGVNGSPASVASDMRDRFDVPIAIVTCGSDGAAACDGDGACSAQAIEVEATIDRFGSGDAFAAGFLSGYLTGAPTPDSLRLGVAAAALKRTIPGDILIATHAELLAAAAQETAAWR